MERGGRLEVATEDGQATISRAAIALTYTTISA
jgi:hypothetical protein